MVLPWINPMDLPHKTGHIPWLTVKKPLARPQEYVWGEDPQQNQSYSPYTTQVLEERFRKVGILRLGEKSETQVIKCIIGLNSDFTT